MNAIKKNKLNNSGLIIITKILLIIILLFTYFLSLGQNITGRWEGMLKIESTKLMLVFNTIKTKKGNTTKLDCPDHCVMARHEEYTDFKDSTLFLKIQPLGISYKDHINGTNSISGIFEQSGLSIPINIFQKQFRMVGDLNFKMKN